MTLSIAGAIDSYLVETDVPREPDGWFHPSSMFQCDRYSTYSVRGVPESDGKEPEDHRALVMGRMIHELAQAAVSHADVMDRIELACHEVKVVIPDLRVKGSADSLVFFADGTAEVEEFKSAKTRSLQWRGWEPKANHIAQGLTYAYGMKYHSWVTTYEDGVETIHPPLGDVMRGLNLVYFGKDDFRIIERRYDLTPEWETTFLAYMANLHRYQGGEALPPRLPLENGKKNWLCESYCPWRSRCWLTDGEGA